MSKKIRTRFAPSPTGNLHIGSLRTALYAYALAKHSGGDFLLRIEDTDQKREVEGSREQIKSTLQVFGINWDEFYVQSERVHEGIYKSAAEKLVIENHAFYCQCKPKNAKEGHVNELRDPCRDKNLQSGAIKLRAPDNEMVSYYDFVHRKEISWNTGTVYDATLLKSDGFPTYHLAVVVDDLDMQISHVLRGHDWLPSTPIHLLVYKYLSKPHPEIGHLTDILSTETGKKLSKRRDSVFVEKFIENGYLPEALLNFIMLLGWAPKDNRELFTLEEFVKEFSETGFQDANPRFLQDKLDWFNGEYIRKLAPSALAERINAFYDNKFSVKKLGKVVPLVRERIKTLKEFEELAGFFFEPIKADASLFKDGYLEHLKVALQVIENLDTWDLDTLNTKLLEAVHDNEFKTGDFFMSLRVAITGKKFTPPINDSIVILGKEDTLLRIRDLL
ncbi:glutamate--tRNA ligase [Candidatus Microgenomates bacterium]|nr:MAG: glutamate--tRNA ligase [Candidatus Microgenomates bacterium]